MLCDDVHADSTGARKLGPWIACLLFQSPTESEWFMYAVLDPTNGFSRMVHGGEVRIRRLR